MIKHLLICTLLILSTSTLATEISAEINERLDKTEAAIIKARSNNSLWRDTEKLFSEAKALAAQNNLNEAQELLNTVEFQINTATQQAVEQDDKEVLPYYLK